MARRKTQAQKKVVELEVAASDEKTDRITEVIPTPPPGPSEEKLTVDIPTEVSWRLRLALLTMESKGRKTAKKKFVERAIVHAIDKLDTEWGATNG